MPQIDTNQRMTEVVRRDLFTSCYRNCRTIRDVVAFIDDETAQLTWRPNFVLSYNMISRINSEECREDVKRWRDVFGIIWNDLKKDNRIVLATDDVDDRTIEELVSIYMTTVTVIHALERAIYRRLLQNH